MILLRGKCLSVNQHSTTTFHLYQKGQTKYTEIRKEVQSVPPMADDSNQNRREKSAFVQWLRQKRTANQHEF